MEDFRIKLREVVVYIVPLDFKDDSDVIENYVDCLILAFEEYKDL